MKNLIFENFLSCINTTLTHSSSVRAYFISDDSEVKVKRLNKNKNIKKQEEKCDQIQSFLKALKFDKKTQ